MNSRLLKMLVLLTFSQFSLAESNIWFVTVQGGIGIQTVDKEKYLIAKESNGEEDRDNTMEVVLAGGYRFSNGLTLETQIRGSMELIVHDLSDGYIREEAQFLLGYTFQVSDHFEIILKIGYSTWNLKYTDKTHIGGEKEFEKNFSGLGKVAALDLVFPIGDLVSINVGYHYGDLDFGNTSSISCGVRFSF